jgi:hypothetical protein
MASAFWQGAMILALAGAVGLVIEHHTCPGLDQTTEIVGLTFPDDETTGSVDRAAEAGWIRLSDEQRGWIFLGVMNLPDVPDEDMAPPALAEVLPESVELQDMPAMVTRKIPLMREHKFVKLDDRILVVRPGDRVVVSEIPRYRLIQ